MVAVGGKKSHEELRSWVMMQQQGWGEHGGTTVRDTAYLASVKVDVAVEADAIRDVDGGRRVVKREVLDTAEDSEDMRSDCFVSMERMPDHVALGGMAYNLGTQEGREEEVDTSHQLARGDTAVDAVEMGSSVVRHGVHAGTVL